MIYHFQVYLDLSKFVIELTLSNYKRVVSSKKKYFSFSWNDLYKSSILFAIECNLGRFPNAWYEYELNKFNTPEKILAIVNKPSLREAF